MVLEKERLANWIASVISEIVKKLPPPTRRVETQGEFIDLTGDSAPMGADGYVTVPMSDHHQPQTMLQSAYSEPDETPDMEFTFPGQEG